MFSDKNRTHPATGQATAPAATPPRRRGRPPGPTPRSAETRAALYKVAIEMFAMRGYEETTLRAIADRAGVSPGLLYRYFPSKRAVVLALYDQLTSEFQERARTMQAGRWRERFIASLETSLGVLGPHRSTLVALVPILVAGRDEGLFAPATALSRERVRSAFIDAVVGATDSPRRADAESLGRALDLAHLSILLFWLLDRSENQRATSQIVGALRRVLPAFSLAYRLRVVRDLVRDVDEAARSALYGEAQLSCPRGAR